MTPSGQPRRALPARAYAVAAWAVLFLLLAQAVGHSWVRVGHPLVRRQHSAAHAPQYEWLLDGAAIDALRAWNGAGARFQFSWGRYGSGRVSCSEPNGNRDTVWSDSVCGQPWGTYTLALAQTWFNRLTGEAVDSDVVFNRNRDWAIYDGPQRFAVDFRRVALHEFGHVLGLDHPDDHGQFRNAIMNSRVSDLDRLQSDDVNGIRGLYGSEPRRGTPDLVVESLQASPRTLTAGDALHPVGQRAERRGRGCGGDDAALLLLSVQQRGMGGRGVGRRGRASRLDEPFRVDRPHGAVARGHPLLQRVVSRPSPASGTRTTAPAACG